MTENGKKTFPRGIHPPEGKEASRNAPVEVLPEPDSLVIPLVQHIGAPCEPAVSPRQKVSAGDLLGRSEKFVSAPVHAPLPGTAGLPISTTLPNGRHVAAIPLKVEKGSKRGEEIWNTLVSSDWPVSGLEERDPESIRKDVLDGGLVGQGGASFPTHVKFVRNEKKPVRVLLVNGCECEPCLTADDRLMRETPGAIVSGALLAARASGAQEIKIVVERNKPEAIEKLRHACRETPVTVVPVETKYPMGGERQLIPAVLGQSVPTGGLPLDIGVVVVNVASAASVALAVLKKTPLTHRVVSVSGRGIRESKNLFVPVGIPLSTLVEFCGGLTENAARVIAGGPMMGFTPGSLECPVTKGTSGFVVLTRDEASAIDESACVRCGRCVDVCPLHLVPTKIAIAARFQNWEVARAHHLAACCECGCCAYTCPAGIPLVQLIRTGKARMPRE